MAFLTRGDCGMGMLGLTTAQLVGVLALGLLLLLVLLGAKLLLRLTRRIVRVGCLGIIVVLLAAYVVVRLLGT